MNNFSLDSSLELLVRTPVTLRAWLFDLSENWIAINEGGETWSAYDIMGHLVHGERKDWTERTKIILSEASDKTFEKFDRFAQFTESEGKSINDLINEFQQLRMDNIRFIKSLDLSESDFTRTGIHPAFGIVTLQNLLSTWVVHDMNHLAQIARIMANRYRQEVGPWTEYLRILSY